MERSRGFTLIELLLVVVIMGILVAVLIPRFANTREKAFVATMKADLRNLATAEESYFYDYQTYVASVASLTAFRPSTGVTVTVNEATAGGWSATAQHPNSSKQCYLYVGGVSPVGSATQEGQVSCQ